MNACRCEVGSSLWSFFDRCKSPIADPCHSWSCFTMVVSGRRSSGCPAEILEVAPLPKCALNNHCEFANVTDFIC